MRKSHRHPFKLKVATQELVAIEPNLHFKDKQMKVRDQEALVSTEEHYSRKEAASLCDKKRKEKREENIQLLYSEWGRKGLQVSDDFHWKKKNVVP